MTEFPYYIPNEIKNQFLKARKIIEETEQDRVYVITGREGSGKSLLAMQFAYFIDENFSLNDIAFNGDQFEKLIRETDRKVVIYDEAFSGLSSKGAISKENKRLIQLLVECRQRKLIVFIVLPSIFLLEKYVGIFRSNALFNVAISKNNYKNRFYKAYNYTTKKLLYMLGKKYMSYSKPKVIKKYRFYGKYPPTISRTEYNQKKLDAFRGRDTEMESENTIAMIQRDSYVHFLKHIKGLTFIEIEKLMKDYPNPQDKSAMSRNTSKLIKKHPKITKQC